MIDVLMLSYHDWANTGYRFKKCLEYLGYNVVAFKGFPHTMSYPEQIAVSIYISRATQLSAHPELYKVPELRWFAEQAEVIHFIASTIVDTGVNITDKKVVAQHGGSTYRMRPMMCNNVFNNFVNASIMQFPTLLSQGAKNEHLIYYPVDTSFIQPVYGRQDKKKLIIGHFPSSWESKGTDVINQVIRELSEDTEFSDRFEYVGLSELTNELRVGWLQNLERMSQCDIIIETIKPELSGKPFCEWGNTALEASALGKIVITNTASTKLYEQEYGCVPPLHIANSDKELKLALQNILSKDDLMIRLDKERHRTWAEEKHSIPVTAERLYEKVYKHLLPNRRK
jgi:glycosyltransferase involved in cell wall biosynthesis